MRMASLKIRVDSRRLSAVALFFWNYYGHSSLIPSAVRGANGAAVIGPVSIPADAQSRTNSLPPDRRRSRSCPI